jgi:hypothetical protein
VTASVAVTGAAAPLRNLRRIALPWPVDDVKPALLAVKRIFPAKRHHPA